MNKLCSVYWIHLPEHTDITSEGYVGITTRDAMSRYTEHLKVSETNSRTILSNAIRKYKDNLVVTVLLKGDEDYCLLIENKLRPSDRIGWNTTAGGGKPPKHEKHTEEAKRKIGEASRLNAYTPAKLAAYARKVGVPRTEESRAKMREKAQGRLPWETSKANKDVWAVAGEVFEAHKSNPEFGHKKLERILGFKKNTLANMYDKFKKQNWNPLEDSKWLEWVQTYTKY